MKERGDVLSKEGNEGKEMKEGNEGRKEMEEGNDGKRGYIKEGNE